MKWEQQLRVALAEGQLFLAYQPKIDLTRRCITGFEALVRWNHPQHGLIPANEFIPVAESTGLIVPIGDFVIETACRQLALWQQQGYDTLSLAVNISAVQFWRGDLYETISRAIEESGISARRLELEITETAMMEYPELVSEKIFALKRLGVRIALDDFGTGYSSLSYLNRFSVDTLKVDRSFIQAIPDDRSVCVMVTAIVNLGALARPHRGGGRHRDRRADCVARGARPYRGAGLPVLAPGSGRGHSGAARTLRRMRHAGAATSRMSADSASSDDQAVEHDPQTERGIGFVALRDMQIVRRAPAFSRPHSSDPPLHHGKPATFTLFHAALRHGAMPATARPPRLTHHNDDLKGRALVRRALAAPCRRSQARMPPDEESGNRYGRCSGSCSACRRCRGAASHSWRNSKIITSNARAAYRALPFPI